MYSDAFVLSLLHSCINVKSTMYSDAFVLSLLHSCINVKSTMYSDAFVLSLLQVLLKLWESGLSFTRNDVHTYWSHIVYQ